MTVITQKQKVLSHAGKELGCSSKRLSPQLACSMKSRRFAKSIMRIFLTFLLICRIVAGFKPVILIHGILDNGGGLADLANHIRQANPGTNVTSLDLYDDLLSLVPLDRQIPDFINKVRALMQKSPDGVDLICHSQGGLVCRGIVEMMPDHNVHSLITLSSPLLGQYGVPSSWLKFLPFLQNKTREEITDLVYTDALQNVLSVSNYWRDPREKYFSIFEAICRYLPTLDNNPKAKNYQEKVALAQKKNFLRLKHLVTLGGPDDGVINPWQSSSFEYLSPDLKSIIPMEKQTVYVEDWFGLRSLDERGGLTRYIVPGINHAGWHRDIDIFNKYIRPWLK